MKSVTLKKFMAMREALITEKEALIKRLEEINQALGESASSAPAVKKAAAAEPRKAKRTKWKRVANAMSLKDAVLQVTKKGPLTKKEIVEAVQKIGFKFASSNPINRLGVLLYGKDPKFKNENGKFSPISN